MTGRRRRPFTRAWGRPGCTGSGDTGSGSVLVLGLVLVALTGLTLATAVGAWLVRAAQLRAAADLGALTAADTGGYPGQPPGPCPASVQDVVRMVVSANSARLLECRVGADGSVLVGVGRAARPVTGPPSDPMWGDRWWEGPAVVWARAGLGPGDPGPDPGADSDGAAGAAPGGAAPDGTVPGPGGPSQ